VKSGTPKPDISSAEALRRALLAAKSIAYSDSASGVYISTEMFPRLGIVDDMKGKARAIPAEPVAAVVSRGEAEIGFQQISELLPVAGVDMIGPLAWTRSRRVRRISGMQERLRYFVRIGWSFSPLLS
jgi:molybdate transport system substrate-binding protein